MLSRSCPYSVDLCDNQGKATPFVKWVGGKRSIMPELISRLPESFNNYWESFAGGSALFFELQSVLNQAHLSDANLDLIMAYKVIQRDPEPLITRLKEHAVLHTEEYYYSVREQHALQDPIEIAARFIYLNKTCYNGLWRVNSQGRFNVPFGRYVNPGIAQEDNIRACHAALQGVDIRLGEYNTNTPAKGDFSYFDPPYHPTGDTSFTKYSKSDFTEQDQVRLRNFILEQHRKGVWIMLSNSDTPFIRDLYSAKVFKIETVMVARVVNCKPGKRGAVSEVIITNY